MENKEQRVWMVITIVTVSVLVLIFAGITYAFFTTSDNEGSTAEIISDSGKMLINYEDGTNTLVVAKNISPSNSRIIADKTFSVTGTNTTDGLTMPFSISLEYQNTFQIKTSEIGELLVLLKRTDSNENINIDIVSPFEDYGFGMISQEFIGEGGFPQELLGYNVNYIEDWSNTTHKQKIATGYFKPNSINETATFSLKMLFLDTGANQDYNKGATFNGKIVIENGEENILNIASLKINNLYDTSDKDENGITIDGLQKDGTGSINIQYINNNSNKNYQVSFLDTTYDEYDNLRYVGSNPNNYIVFNNEMWRIIGLFKNIITIDENGVEKKENLVKIVRNESLGHYSWDISDSSINYGYGINEWSQADLMTELNTDYIDTSKTSGTTMWYDSSNNQKNGEYYYSNNINSDYIDKIANVRWNLGGINDKYSVAQPKNYSNNTSKLYPKLMVEDMDVSYSAIDLYSDERKNNHVINPSDGVSDGVTRTDYWDGKIGLVYPSDYVYALSNSTCNSYISYKNCSSKTWLDISMWTISSSVNSRNGVFYAARYTFACSSHSVYPTLFLKSDVTIISGTGTENDPYIIG